MPATWSLASMPPWRQAGSDAKHWCYAQNLSSCNRVLSREIWEISDWRNCLNAGSTPMLDLCDSGRHKTLEADSRNTCGEDGLAIFPVPSFGKSLFQDKPKIQEIDVPEFFSIADSFFKISLLFPVNPCFRVSPTITDRPGQ
jgi:hypothetical protein